MVSEPGTLHEAVKFFESPQNCVDYVAARRWPDGITCPRCGSKKVSYSVRTQRWQCSKRHANRSFSAKTGTVFEECLLPLEKCLIAMWMIVAGKNGVSSHELSRTLGVTQKTAWYLNHRIRLAMANGTLEKLVDDVEADETGIGGLSKNMHKHVRARKIKSTGLASKTIVVGALERGGEIRLQVMANNERDSLHSFVRANVLTQSRLHTDAHQGYTGLVGWYRHQIVDHAYTYVIDNVHTNGLENFWSLLKRTVRGTYVSVEPFHLHRYLGEYAFRFNNRRTTDAERFNALTKQITGKRLTYSELIAKDTVTV